LIRQIVRCAVPLAMAALLSGCCMFEPCIKPDAPPQQASSHMQAPPTADSTISVPLEVLDLRPIQDAVNKSIDSGKDGEGAWGDVGRDGLWDKVSWHRDDVVVTAHDNVISLSTKVYYSVRLAHSLGGTRVQFAQCGHGEPEASATVGVDVTLTPKSDWSVEVGAALVGPTTVTPCKMGMLNYDASAKAVGLVKGKLNDKLNDIRQSVNARLNFKDKATSAWQALQQPTTLAPNTYLVVALTGANLSPIKAANNQVSVIGGLTGKAKVLLGPAVAPAPTPLPPLRISDSDPVINVSLPIVASYDELSAQLNSRLAGRRYPLGGHDLNLKSVSVYGTSDTLVLQTNVGLQGFAEATLYLTGVPQYDVTNRVVSVRNLDYTVATKNILVKLADWLLHSEFLKVLQSEAHFAIGPKVDEMRARATAAMNRSINPHLDVHGKFDSLTLMGFSLTTDDFTAYLNARGSATLDVH